MNTCSPNCLEQIQIKFKLFTFRKYFTLSQVLISKGCRNKVVGKLGPWCQPGWGGGIFHHNFSVSQSPIWIKFLLERVLLVIFEEGGRLWGHWESVSVGWLWPLSSEQQNFSSSQIIRSFANAASRYFRKDIESLSVGWVPPFICAAKLSPQSKPSHSPTLPTLTSTPSGSLGTWENLIIRSFLPISSSSSHWQLLDQVCRVN